MHGYSTDSSERKLVPLLLASVAIALAWVWSRILAVMDLSVPWWLDAPSGLAFYGALYALFDRYLWRNGLFSKLGLVILSPLLTAMRNATTWWSLSSRVGRISPYSSRQPHRCHAVARR